MRKYAHHKYIYSRPWRLPHHQWEFVCAEGAVHFTASFYKDDEPPSCGLEFHHIAGQGAPDHVDCPLTGGRGWHDGTSLYANESVWPSVELYLRSGDHDQIFRVLEHEAWKHFEKDALADASE